MGLWKRLNQSGLGVTEVLIALGIGTAVVGTASYFSIEAFKSDKNEEFSMWLDQRRSEMLYTLQNESGWENIKKNNGGIDCAETDVDKCRELQNPQPLDLPLGNQILKGSSPNLGISPEGQFCYDFDAVKGNRNCPVGVDLKWKIVCGSVDCKDAQPNVAIKFSHSTNSGLKLNLSTYNINFFKDSRTQTISDVCEGLGGVYQGGKCVFNPNSCDPSNPTAPTYPIGFDAEGKVICGTPNVGSCSSNDYLAGFNADGSVICAPRCTGQNNPVDCVGEWGECNPADINWFTGCGGGSGGGTGGMGSATMKTTGSSGSTTSGSSSATGGACPNGERTYTILTQAQNGGQACPYPSGKKEYCYAPAPQTPVNCVGSWGECKTLASGSFETFTITTQAQNGGTACSATTGAMRACTPPANPVNCVGSWGACNKGTKKYTITTPASGGGQACEAANGATTSCLGTGDSCQTCPSGWTSFNGTCTKPGTAQWQVKCINIPYGYTATPTVESWAGQCQNGSKSPAPHCEFQQKPGYAFACLNWFPDPGNTCYLPADCEQTNSYCDEGTYNGVACEMACPVTSPPTGEKCTDCSGYDNTCVTATYNENGSAGASCYYDGGRDATGHNCVMFMEPQPAGTPKCNDKVTGSLGSSSTKCRTLNWKVECPSGKVCQMEIRDYITGQVVDSKNNLTGNASGVSSEFTTENGKKYSLYGKTSSSSFTQIGTAQTITGIGATSCND